ncbi:methylated-DNA--[protein]-cysteine S-methyltransferase [Sinomicrobium soli]|uniref:methylated-DNA--[protein]-cysteine S-methyltransferase n=1 Tax=Sinomicrobium sp. N-1-3-6 TaxID=2219864 RepID=UPI000DCE1F85|nr:methylated-DNA--[protein]-cysteine S-methyltransferase [Sinomicrobium sp. N-1-3-6]RAV28346.1 cysteine methyltransferase [Sinomicrobium sp. N-1-3-6]
MKTAIVKTPLGMAQVSGDHNGISQVHVLKEDIAATITSDIPEELLPCVQQLEEYFKGKRKDFRLKLNPQGTGFQKRVWDELLRIPYGRTISYLDLAKRLGDVKSIRAAASANGRNPLWIVIPCHRVIGQDGSLTGYAGGLWRKKWLLEHESPFRQESLF